MKPSATGWRERPVTSWKSCCPLRTTQPSVEKFAAVKQENKERFSRWIYQAIRASIIDPTTMFDVQAKRLHEYKRQLLNALHILVLYNRIVR